MKDKKIKCTTLCPFRMDNGYCLLYSRKIDIYCFQDEEKKYDPKPLPECTEDSDIEDLFK